MNFNILGGVVWVFNIGLFLLLKKQRNIGPKRSAGISGWVTLLLSLILLNFSNISPFSTISSTAILIISVIIIFAILIIYSPALSPNLNLGMFGDLSKLSIQVGSIIGFVMGLLVSLLIK